MKEKIKATGKINNGIGEIRISKIGAEWKAEASMNFPFKYHIIIWGKTMDDVKSKMDLLFKPQTQQ